MLEALVIRREILLNRFSCPFSKSYNREKIECWQCCETNIQSNCDALVKKLRAVEDKILDLTEILMDDSIVIDFKQKKYGVKEVLAW